MARSKALCAGCSFTIEYTDQCIRHHYKKRKSHKYDTIDHLRLLSFIVYEKGEKLRQHADNQRLINVVIHLLEFLAEDDNGDQHYRNLC